MSDSHDAHHVKYWHIFVVLCICTVLSVAFDVLDLVTFFGEELAQRILIVLIFAVASAKAFCVLAFFMHLKFEGNWKYLLLAPTTILAIGLPLALTPDIAAHYYTVDVPQNDEYMLEHGTEDVGEAGQEPVGEEGQIPGGEPDEE